MMILDIHVNSLFKKNWHIEKTSVIIPILLTSFSYVYIFVDENYIKKTNQ